MKPCKITIRAVYSMLLCSMMLWCPDLQADPPAAAKKASAQLPIGNLDTKDWLKTSTKPLGPHEIDRLVKVELAKVDFKPAPLTTDEQFIRRVTIDLTGRLPMPADISEFLADKSVNKRAKLIDKLLDSKNYARHWSLYWRSVLVGRNSNDFRVVPVLGHFERWMTEQLQANRHWDQITRDLLTAKGQILNAEPEKNGQAVFLVSHQGADTVTELAGDTSRIFLGIQIQCAQCHDHPSDVWKRRQFHEFAAYFARYAEKPVRDGMRRAGGEIFARPFAEYQMPGKDEPKKTTKVDPKFLDGKGPKTPGFGKRGLTDDMRRASLADSITAKSNPWFAAAFVNRIWGELMGQAFYAPIDDMGPRKDAVMPTVAARVAGSFRGNDYDIKQLLRDIMNSQTYQRQIRPGESGEEHTLFAAHNPVRMNADALWQTLTSTLGQMGPPPGKFGMAAPKGPFGRFQSLEAQFKQEFAFDPSTKAEEIEGSISQVLMLMNNPQINQRMKAQGTNLLARILTSYKDDNEALRILYLRGLARWPTDRETARCMEHLRSAASRAEAFEDILWALINSTEYQTKR